MLTVADLDVLCAAPRKRGALLGVDTTFATPLNQRPLALGADVSVQSVTKFIGGDSDLLGGVVTCETRTCWPRYATRATYENTKPLHPGRHP